MLNKIIDFLLWVVLMIVVIVFLMKFLYINGGLVL